MPRFVRPLALVLALAATFAVPARADMLSLPALARIVNANPPLSAGSNAGRYYVSLTKNGVQIGYLDSSIIDRGYLIDNRDVLIVPLPSGGSGGVFTTLLFTNVTKKPTYVGKIDSQGHLDVYIAQGLINARTPVYGPGEPNCCPSGHRTVRYRLQGTALVKVDEFKS